MTQDPFFINEDFYTDVEDYLIAAELEKEDVEALPDDYEVKIEESTLEPMIELTHDWLIDQIMQSFEERFPEDNNRVNKDFLASVKCLDLAKCNDSMPKLWYPNGKWSVLTKQDLLDAIK